MKKLLIFGGIGVVLIILVVVLVSTISKRNSAPKNLTLTVWSPFNEAGVFKSIGDSYTKLHPTIKVDFKYVDAKDAKDYEAQVVNAYANGIGPDIWLMRNDWLPKHAAKLTSIPSTFAWSGSEETQNEQLITYFGKSIVEQNSTGGKFYTVPVSVDSLVLYQNTKVIEDVKQDLANQDRDLDADSLDQFPLTWADVVKISKLITQRNGQTVTRSGLAIGTVDNTYAATDVYLSLLTQYGGSLFNNDGSKNNFSLVTRDIRNRESVPSQQALDLYTSFSRADNANYTWNSSLGDPVTLFAQGKVAMMVGFSSLAKEIYAENPEAQVTIGSLPQVIKDADIVNYAAYWSFGVSKKSASPNSSWGFLKYLHDEKVNEAYLTATGRPGLSKYSNNLTDSFDIGSIKEMKNEIFSDQINSALVVCKPDWQQVDVTLKDMISQVNSGNSLKTALDTASASFDKQVTDVTN